MSADQPLTRENIDRYLGELAKQFKKLGGKAMPAEIILVGGASILINYGFRDSTYDIDAYIHASSNMKDAINRVTDTMGLPNGWLNDDFKKTKSYTPRLVTYSKYYREFSHVLTVRTVTGAHLVAMKLMAYRPYKHDISDIAGIILEQQKKGEPLTYEQITGAVCDLYDSWEKLPGEAHELLVRLLNSDHLEKLYDTYTGEEKQAKDVLISFDENYPNVLREDNMNDILKHLQGKYKEQP